MRPRPRLIATVDIDTVADRGARLLWSMAGSPARLTPLSTEVLACDAQVVPVLFSGARPVAVGDASSPIGAALRTALVARDGGCRFPGCGAPVAWCDAHHLRARSEGGATSIKNLGLFCRRHHRLIHRHRWRITLHEDGTMEFSRRGRRFVSRPRARPPRRE